MLGYYNYIVILTYIGMLFGFIGLTCAIDGQLPAAGLNYYFFWRGRTYERDSANEYFMYTEQPAGRTTDRIRSAA